MNDQARLDARKYFLTNHFGWQGGVKHCVSKFEYTFGRCSSGRGCGAPQNAAKRGGEFPTRFSHDSKNQSGHGKPVTLPDHFLKQNTSAHR